LNHLDLFSGIGGFALAAKNAGCSTVGFVEIDPSCQDVLKKHWPDVPIHSDILTFSPPATRASRSRQPLEAAITRATSGLKPYESFDSLDRVGSCLRTSLATGLSMLSGRAVTSKIVTMPSGRSMLQLRSATTSGGASGLWPTPTAKANHDAPSMRKWPAYARQQDDGGISPSRWEWMMGYGPGHTA
jgi:hypothetical protein